MYTLRVGRSTAVIVTDEERVPMDFKKTKTTTTVDKVALKKAIIELADQGVIIDGAYVENRTNLQIK